jgi:cytochrome b subunit of formate dehydrogenase
MDLKRLKGMDRRRNAKKTVHIILGLLTILVIISGLGITYFRSIEVITLGLFDKNVSFQIHNLLFLPFLFILLIHVLFPWLWSKKQGRN